jgi:indole-3-glycerol phosphate synthase
MTTVLDDIIAGVRLDMLLRMEQVSAAELEQKISQVAAAKPVLPHFQTADLGLISEVKRRSPSKGDLAEIPDPAWLAAQYAAGGASAISVLTEQRRFNGSLDDLAAVRAAVDIPVLRKDFMVDTYQLLEARAFGADLILLIVAGLDQSTLTRLHAESLELGMTVLVEVHDAEEIERALDAGAQMIGVNNRDLRTLEVHPDQFVRLSERIPAGITRIAESGITSPADVKYYADAGADGLLIGEALVKQGDPKAAVEAFLAAGRSQRRVNEQS